MLKCMYVDEPEVLERIISSIPDSFTTVLRLFVLHLFTLRFCLKQLIKGQALLHLASKLNLSPDQVMAVGDQENDQAMLEVAGLPVAMDNASPELKEIAKVVTRSNDESGVAYALRKWVLH